MPLRLTRGDLGHFPADVYVLSTSGGLSGKSSSANNILEGLKSRVEGVDLVSRVRSTLQPRLTDGDAAWVSLDGTEVRGLLCIRASSSATLKAALVKARALLERHIAGQPWTVAFPAIGTGAKAGKIGAAESAAVFKEVFGDYPGEVVVVAWSPADFRAFQQALDEDEGLDSIQDMIELQPPLSERAPEVRDSFSSFIRCLASPDSFLFVGSGFSFNAVPGMPSWKNLFDPSWFEGKGAFPPEDLQCLPDMAQIAADTNGVRCVHDVFIEKIKAVQETARPGFLHYHLLGLPWRAIVTTNYDTLIEDTLTRLNIRHTVITCDQDLAGLPSREGIPVVKIHGGLVRTQGGLKAAGDIVATRDEYDRFFLTRPALASWMETQLMTSRGVLVGYSISDPHLRQLFARIGQVATPSDADQRLFCITFDSSPVPHYWRRRGMEILKLRRDGDFPDFIDATVTKAWRQRTAAMVPADLLSGDDWAELANKLDSKQTATLAEALLSAGASVPSAILKKLSGEDLDAFLSHISPEQALWIKASL